MDHPSHEALESYEVRSGEALDFEGREESARIDAHIAGCEGCREALSAIRRADFALTTGLVLEVSPPEPGRARPARPLPRLAEWRESVLRALDPKSRALPVVGVFALVGVLVPALWWAS